MPHPPPPPPPQQKVNVPFFIWCLSSSFWQIGENFFGLPAWYWRESAWLFVFFLGGGGGACQFKMYGAPSKKLITLHPPLNTCDTCTCKMPQIGTRLGILTPAAITSHQGHSYRGGGGPGGHVPPTNSRCKKLCIYFFQYPNISSWHVLILCTPQKLCSCMLKICW